MRAARRKERPARSASKTSLFGNYPKKEHTAHPGPCRAYIGNRVSTFRQLGENGPKVQEQDSLRALNSLGTPYEVGKILLRDMGTTRYVGALGEDAFLGEYYEEAFADLEAEDYCIFVTPEGSRLTRSGDVHTALLLQRLRSLVPKIVFADMPQIDTDSEIGEFLTATLGAGIRYLWSLTKKKLLKARAVQAWDGFYAGGALPIGFQLVKDEAESAARGRDMRRVAVYAPHAAVVVRALEALRATGVGFSYFILARQLVEQEITLPPFPPELAGMDDIWSLRLTEPLADGTFAMSPSVLAGLVNGRACEGVLRFGNQEMRRRDELAFVDPDLLADVRRIDMATRGRTQPRGRRPEVKKLLLQGLVYCDGEHDRPHDEAKRMGTSTRDAIYRCEGDYRRYGADFCGAIRDHYIETPVVEWFGQLLASGQINGTPALAALEAELVGEQRDVRRNQRDQRELRNKCTTRRRQIEREEVKAVADLDQIEAWQLEIADIETKLAAFDALDTETEKRRITHDLDTVRTLLRALPADWPTSANKRLILDMFIDRVTVAHSDEYLYVTIVPQRGETIALLVERPGQARRETWTPADDAQVMALWPRSTWEEIALAFPERTRGALCTRAHKLGVQRVSGVYTYGGRYAPWTAEDDAVVRRWVDGELTTREATGLLGRTAGALGQRRRALGCAKRGTVQKKVRWRTLVPGQAVDFIDTTNNSNQSPLVPIICDDIWFDAFLEGERRHTFVAALVGSA